MGRNPEKKKAYTAISFETKKDFRERLNKFCAEKGINRSEFIRQSIRKYMKEYE